MRDSAEMRAKELVVLQMEDHQGRPLLSKPMPRYVAEGVLAYVSPQGAYDGVPIRSLIIIPLGLVEAEK